MGYPAIQGRTVPEDSDLIDRILGGDLRAFEILYGKHKREVFQTALAITRDREAAEEILQDCFVRAYANIQKLDKSPSIAPWLHRVAVNLSYSWHSRRRAWLMPLEDVLDRLAAPAGLSPERHVERDEIGGIVRDAIDSLSPKHRAVIVLYYLHGFSLAEIADILDCPAGTVKSRLHYACKCLERVLREDRRISSGVAYEFR